MRTEVILAEPDQEPVLANLLELYVHDFSEFRNLKPGEDGRFGYPSLPLYWSEPDRHPFLIRMDGRLAGLILVKKGSAVSGDDSVWDMAEFFVIRGLRRLGVGTQAAHEVWRRFPGTWEVRVMEANIPAQAFWTRTISQFAGDTIHPLDIENESGRWTVFSFESRRW